MVPARLFKGGTGVISINRSIVLVSWAWPKTMKRQRKWKIAINRRPTKLRFPQGSESLDHRLSEISVTAARSGRINPGTEKSGDRAARASAMGRSVFGFHRSWLRAFAVGGRDWFGVFDRFIVDIAVRFHRVFCLLGFVAGVVNVVRIRRGGPRANAER